MYINIYIQNACFANSTRSNCVTMTTKQFDMSDHVQPGKNTRLLKTVGFHVYQKSHKYMCICIFIYTYIHIQCTRMYKQSYLLRA